MASEPTLRPAIPADAETIAAYHHRCWQIGYRGLIPDEALDQMKLADRVERWHSWCADPETFRTVVAVLDKKPVAHTTVVGNLITNVYVDPDFWRQGLGRIMLAEAERMIADAGHTEAVLTTVVGNEPALALYETNGWIRQPELRPSEVFGVVFDEHELRKTLR